MKKKRSLKVLIMISIMLLVSVLISCGSINNGWKVISLEEANKEKEEIKVTKEESLKSIPDGLIYDKTVPIDQSKMIYASYQYIVNDIGDEKESIENIQTGKEVIVNKEKFGNDKEVKSILAGGQDGFIIGDYVIVFLKNPNYKENKNHIGEFKEIKWYNLKTEEWNKIDLKDDMNVSTIIIGFNNDELFTLSYDVKGKEFDEVNEKIYSLNLKTAKLREESNLKVKGAAYLDYDYLNDNKIIFTNVPNPNTVVRILDFKNKIFSELMDQNLYYTNDSIYMLNETLSPSKDRFFYEIEQGGVVSVWVLIIGEDDKVKAEGKVYEYYKGDKTHINWSKDGKKLVISEKINFNGEPENYKILEFNE